MAEWKKTERGEVSDYNSRRAFEDGFRAGRATVAEDAARYRWLRNPPSKGVYTHEYLSVCGQEDAYFGERLDAMIDAVRKGEG